MNKTNKMLLDLTERNKIQWLTRTLPDKSDIFYLAFLPEDKRAQVIARSKLIGLWDSAGNKSNTKMSWRLYRAIKKQQNDKFNNELEKDINGTFK